MELPKNAKRVFKGIIFDVYHWRQKMFDGSLATFEKVVKQNTVVVIAVVGQKIVVLKQSQPGSSWFYDLPSGRMDIPGESPKQAALRELLEETGLKPGHIKLWKTYRPSGKIVNRVYYFIARDCQKISRQKLDKGEKIKVLYKTYQEFLKLSDHNRCFLGPLTTDVLLARIHKTNSQYLKTCFFGSPGCLPRPPLLGPKTNW